MNALLLLMGGSGERFGGETPKQFLDIDFEGAKRPLFEITARKFFKAIRTDICIFVAPQTDAVSPVLDGLRADFPACKMVLAKAGDTRYGSFRSGLKALEGFTSVERLMVHDANRPYLAHGFLTRVQSSLDSLSPSVPAFIPVAPVVDSIVRLEGTHVARYEDRQELRRVQTPQLIHYPTFREKYAAAMARGEFAPDFTDEGSLCLLMGMKVASFKGDVENVKITFPADLLPEKL